MLSHAMAHPSLRRNCDNCDSCDNCDDCDDCHALLDDIAWVDRKRVALWSTGKEVYSSKNRTKVSFAPQTPHTPCPRTTPVL